VAPIPEANSIDDQDIKEYSEILATLIFLLPTLVRARIIKKKKMNSAPY
tara:strand:+ start:428 stop:574 length:147 start_codon:yes stop_codon:yes gene_type:complete